MNPELIAAATTGASRGVIEYKLRGSPVAAVAAGLALSLTVQALSDRPDLLIVVAIGVTVGALILANRLA